MIPKVISPHAYDFQAPQVSVLPFHRRGVDEHYHKKVSKEIGSGLFDSIVKSMKPIPNHTVIHVIAVGDQEWFGENRNYDGFPEEDNKRCHHLFKSQGFVFKDHDNDDPEKKTGDVVATGHNDAMHRVELLAALDNDKNPDEVEALENGEDVPVSMGVLQPYDICSCCGNKATSPKTHCFHIKNMLGEVLEDGTKIFMINPDPNYMDLSTVWKPADRIGYTLRKVAIEGLPVPGYRVAERFGMQKLASEKYAMLRRLAMIEKRIDGVAKPSTAPEDLDAAELKALKTAVAAHGVDAVLDTLHKHACVLSIGDFAEAILCRPGLRKYADDASAHLPNGFTRLLRDGLELTSLDGQGSSTPLHLEEDLYHGLRKAASMSGPEASRRALRHSLSSQLQLKLAHPGITLPDPAATKGLADLYLHYKVGFACHHKNRSDEAALTALTLSNVLPG